MVDLAGAEQPRGLIVAQEEVGEEPLGQDGRAERLGETIPGQRSLGRVLEDHRIAGEQSRHDRVDGGEEGIVPGGDHQDEAGGRPSHRPAGSRDEGRQGDRGQLDHRQNPLRQGALLAAVADRPAHLPCDLGDDVGVQSLHRGEETEHRRTPFVEGGPGPFEPRPARVGQGAVDLAVRRQPPPRIFAAVDGGNADQLVHLR